MNLKAETALRIPPIHPTTDTELVRMIDSYFPELQGWLKELRDRFAEKVAETPEGVSGKVQCPSCGTLVKISEVEE